MFATISRTIYRCTYDGDEGNATDPIPGNPKLTNKSLGLDFITGVVLLTLGLLALRKNQQFSPGTTAMIIAGSVEIGTIFGLAVYWYNYN